MTVVLQGARVLQGGRVLLTGATGCLGVLPNPAP